MHAFPQGAGKKTLLIINKIFCENALFSYRINHLTEHVKKNKKDVVTRRSLLRLVGKRRQLLDYLQKIDIERYRKIVKELGLRR